MVCNYPLTEDSLAYSLANIEMRLILAHLLLEFDFELQPESKGWAKQDVYIGLIKPSLMIKLHSARESQP